MQAFDSVFTSTYESYLIIIDEIFAASTADDLHFQLRYGSTTRANAYYGATQSLPYTGSSVLTQMSNVNQFTIATSTGATGRRSSGVIYINRVGQSAVVPNWKGQFMDAAEVIAFNFGGQNEATDQINTGFLLKSSSSNISGTVSIYGLAKS